MKRIKLYRLDVFATYTCINSFSFHNFRVLKKKTKKLITVHNELLLCSARTIRITCFYLRRSVSHTNYVCLLCCYYAYDKTITFQSFNCICRATEQFGRLSRVIFSSFLSPRVRLSALYPVQSLAFFVDRPVNGYELKFLIKFYFISSYRHQTAFFIII